MNYYIGIDGGGTKTFIRIINEKEETIKKKWNNIDEVMYLKLKPGQKNPRINDLKKVKAVIKKIDFIEIEKFIDTQIIKIEQI